MDWRDVCLKLSERWGLRDDVLSLPGFTIRFDPPDGSRPKERELHSFYRPPPSNAEFNAAVARYREGNDAALIDYLYSDRPLRDAERWLLAELLALPAKDARFEHKQRVRFATVLARNFYKEVCEECRQLGVCYRGEAKEIQRCCVAAAAEFVKGVTPTEVFDVMGRPIGRRGLD
jgi:hypothetical protein